MPIKSSAAGLKGFPARFADPERAIVERLQAEFGEAGLQRVSLNDVVRHLIRRAEIAVPRTPSEGMAALQAHAEACEECEPYQPPRCLDGVYLRELNRRVSAAASGAPG
jgi:hypothetical protein